jgi:hypothetical protein
VYYTKKTTRKWSISSFVGKILFLFVHKIENRRRVGEETAQKLWDLPLSLFAVASKDLIILSAPNYLCGEIRRSKRYCGGGE